jgi:hypothetical protein
VVTGVDLSGSVGDLLAAVALLAAFLFALLVQISERAAEWADEHPPPGSRTSRHATLLEELAVNTAYAAVIAALVALGLVAYDVNIGLDRWVSLVWPRRVLASAILAGLLHLLVSMALVLRRVLLLTQIRLRAARTGGDRSNGDNVGESERASGGGRSSDPRRIRPSSTATRR